MKGVHIYTDEEIQRGFKGKKWRFVGQKEIKDIWGCISYQNEFEMTIQYKIFLKQKRKYDQESELDEIKNRMIYEKTHYGSHDEVDYENYKIKLRRYYQEWKNSGFECKRYPLAKNDKL